MSHRSSGSRIVGILGAVVGSIVMGSMALAQPAPSGSTEPQAPAPSAVPEPSQGPASPVSASGDLTVASRYLFQGFDYSDGRAVLQPNASLAFRNITANVWGNYQLDLQEFNEFDFSLKIAQTFGKLSASAGYVNLQYPNRPTWEPSQEFTLDLGLEAALSPTISVHYDFDKGRGTYTTLGLSHPVGPSASLATNLFYQGHYYEVTGFPAAEIKGSWSHSLGAYTFTPALSYFATWSNGDFKDGAEVPSNWLFALNVARAF
jgi:hypothetical protein